MATACRKQAHIFAYLSLSLSLSLYPLCHSVIACFLLLCASPCASRRLTDVLALVRLLDTGAVCRKSSGFHGVPDVIDWTFTRKQTAFANSNVQLSVGSQYFVVVRTILHNGTQVYSNSNGVRVVPPHPTMRESEQSSKGASKRVARDTLLTPLDAVNLFCPIDAANRCRQSTKTPGAILNEIYGPPQFNTDSQISSLFLIPTTAQDALAIGGDPLKSRAALLALGLPGNQLPPVHHSSDDDEFEPVLPGVAIAGIVVPITVGTMVLMAILALLAWLLASSGGRDYREDRTRVASVAPAAGGATTAAASPPPNDTVRMDFPDLDVRS